VEEFIIQHLPDIAKIIVAFVTGGGALGLYQTFVKNKEVKSNAKIADIKTPVEVESMQIAGMEVLIENLQEDNKVLRDERDRWREGFNELQDRLNAVNNELAKTQRVLMDLQHEMDRLRKSIPMEPLPPKADSHG
jgi:predicted nuclease with TOPRIM domain